MMADASPEPRPARPLLIFAMATVGYLAAITAATWPVVPSLGQGIPGGRTDPAIHLWTMRWYERCLWEGRSPLQCDELNYPVGISLGQNPALHLPAAMFVGLGLVTSSDVLRYDLIWLFAFLTTGLGTMLLCHSVCRDWLSAWLGGLLAMLSGPMLLHGHGHIELIHLGGFPLFLWAWVRWLDRPGARRLLGAVGCYLILAMCAQYFAVMAIFPAVAVVAWSALRGGREGIRPWLRARVPGLVGFGALAMVGVGVLYFAQISSIASGVPMERSRDEFDLYGVAWWGYFVPVPYLRLGPWISPVFYTPEAHATAVETSSYLGLVTLSLLVAALVGRVRFPNRVLWWSLLAVVVALSFGGRGTIGGWRVPLPAGWLRDVFPPMRLTRVPGRFNLFTAVIAAVIATATMKSLLGRLGSVSARTAIVGAVAMLAMLDLGRTPFPISALPSPPAAYSRLLADHPGARLLEIPQYDPAGGGEALDLSSMASYWQSYHHAKTTAAYTAVTNTAYEWRLGHTSPFLDRLVRRDDYATAEVLPVHDLAREYGWEDAAWLYTRVNGIDFLVLHRWLAADHPFYLGSFDRLAARLASAKMLEDDRVSIFDAALLPEPSRPVALPTTGWSARLLFPDRLSAGVEGVAHFAAFVPESTDRVELAVEMISRRRPRRVRLLHGEQVLAEWHVSPRAFETYVSPPFRLPSGLVDLTLEVSDGEDLSLPVDPRRCPLRVSAFLFRPAIADEPSTIAVTTDREVTPR